MTPRTQAIYDGVIDLYPGVDRQALRCLAGLMEKDAGVTWEEFSKVLSLLYSILDAEEHFRNALPEEWDGDPIHDACERARKVLEQGERDERPS